MCNAKHFFSAPYNLATETSSKVFKGGNLCSYSVKLQHYMHLATDYIEWELQWFKYLAFVLYSAEDLNPYRLSCPGSSVGRVLA